MTSISLSAARDVAECEPFRLGVPLLKGLVRESRSLQLAASDGTPMALQTKPLVVWPDGSLKWVLLDWLGGGREVNLALAPPEAEAIHGPVEQPVSVEQHGSAAIVHTAARNFRFQTGGSLRDAFDLQLETDSSGVLVPTLDRVAIIDSGPIRVCVQLTGGFGDAPEASSLRWTAEGHFFANQPLQRWSLSIRNTRAAHHPGGIWELGDAGSVMLRRASASVKPRRSCDRISFSVGRDARSQSCRTMLIDQASSGGEHWNYSNHVDRHGEVRLATSGYRLEVDGATSNGRRADPIATLHEGHQAVLGVYAEHFWQKFPQRLRATTEGVVLDLLPENDGVRHELQGGEQTTHVFWIGEEDTASEAALDRLRVRALPRFTANTLAGSQCVPFITPLTDDEDADYRSLVEAAVDGPNSFFAKRERIDEFGWRHFGDAYGDHEAVYSDPKQPLVSHWNNQYDLVFGLGVRYLRGGDDRWFELMEDMVWHVADIDIYHTDDDKPGYNHGLFWHTVHYIDAGKANHRSYPKGTVGGGPCAEHAYARGMLLYYCLTGESAIRDAVVELGEWVLSLEDGSRTPFRFLSSASTGLSSASGNPDYHGPGRGPGNASETLLTAFELTGRREFLNRVEELMHRVVHPRDDLKRLNLLDAERRWYYNLYLQALGRYLEIKIELEELDAAYHYGRETLLHYVRWMAQHEYPYLQKPDILEYPTETWAAQDMRKSEVFHFASRHATGDERMRFLERAEFFYRYSVSTLATMETRHFCRPIALLLGSGFSFGGFRVAADQAPPPRICESHWPPKPDFVPQKRQALSRAKKLVAASAVLLLCGISVCAAALLFN